MGHIRKVAPAKLFIGMLSPHPGLFLECADIVSREYGSIDLESGVMPWEFTDYYSDEMGDQLQRKFIFFRKLINPGDLPGIKNLTNGIEKQFASGASGSRRINLDPGYVTEAKVVLASTKDYAHRVYIGEDIYAEVTLRYSGKERSFASLDHTYFDFRSDTYRNLFNKARETLREQMKLLKEEPENRS